MDHGLKHQDKTIKLLGKNTEENLQELGLGKEFLDLTFKAKSTNGKNKHWTSPKLKPCVLRAPVKKDEKTIKRLGNSIWKPHIQQSMSIQNISRPLKLQQEKKNPI